MPLAPPALGLMAGMIADEYVPVPPAVSMIAFGMLVVLYAALRNRPVWLAPSLIGAGFLVGCLWHHEQRWRFPADHILADVDGIKNLVRVKGTVVDQPKIVRAGERAHLPGRSLTLATLHLQAVERDGRWCPRSGKVKLMVSGAATQLLPARKVTAEGRLRAIPKPQTPYEPRWDLYNNRRGIYFTLYVAGAEDIEVLEPAHASVLRRLPTNVLNWLKAALTDASTEQQIEGASLLEAMILGQRSGVQRELDEAFLRSGTTHFLSVSGFHVAVLALVAWRICFLLGRSRRSSTAWVLLVILAYAALAEPRMPLIRATIIAVLACGAVILNRPLAGFNWVAAALMVVLLLWPAELFSPGFQLTFGTLTGIKLLTGPIRRRLGERFGAEDPVVTGAAESPARSIASLLSRSLRSKTILTFSVAAAAWLTAMPIVAYHFRCFNTWGAVNSVLLYPFVAVTMLTGFIKLVLSAAYVPLGQLFVPVVNLATGLLEGVVFALSKLPATGVVVRRPSCALICGYYVGLSAAFFLPSGFFQRLGLGGRHRLLAVLVPLAVYMASWVQPVAEKDKLKLGVFEGTAGSFAMIENGSQTTIVFAKSRPDTWEKCERLLQTALIQRGKAFPSAIVCSGRVPDAGGTFEPFGGKTAVLATRDAMQTSAPKKAITLKPGQQFPVSGLTVRLLWRGLGTANRPGRKATASIWQVQCSGLSLIVGMDVDAGAYAFLARHFPDMKADTVLLLGRSRPHSALLKLLNSLQTRRLVYAARTISSTRRWQRALAPLPEGVRLHNAGGRWLELTLDATER